MKKILQSFILTLLLINPAYAEEGDGSESWMNSTITGLLNFLSGCIEVPEFTSMKNTLKDLDLTQSGKWVATRTYVQADKLLKIQWDLKNVEPVPEKYLVLYRIDPRFKKPQVFIQRYDYAQEKYISDFYQAYSGQLLKYQFTPEMLFASRVVDYIGYFNFLNRPKIHVKKDDVINITLSSVGKYFAANSEMQTDFAREPSNPAIIYTESSGMDNAIIYTDIPAWCKVSEMSSTMGSSICAPSNASRPSWCTDTSNCTATTYKSTIDLWDGLVGAPINGPFEAAKLSILPCQNGSDGRGNTPLCKYDKGRGMQLKVGAKIIKPTAESFVSSPYTEKDFFYYKSDADGDLDFTTSWQIFGMFGGGINQFMEFWGAIVDYNAFSTYLATYSAGTVMNFMHFGRYGMEIEIGNSEASITSSDLSNVKVEYIIMEDGAPTDSTSGTEADMDYKINADTSGYLWLRVINDSAGLGGSIKTKIANYTGSTWFSDIVYGKLIQPLREIFNNLTKTVYTKFITNPAVQNIARGMMTVYILFYGLSYLAGATQLTVTDLVVRVLKIGVIIALFSPTSWNFFNDNVFRIFIEGSDYLLSNVVGITSQVGNIFGFIDPIFDKYTNGTVWGLLFIQLLMIHNGLCFFAIMTIYSILLYFRAVLEVIISYCLAFLGLAIMVSLAPFFITFLLFEQTKSMFTNWISTMFQYMMQPTILLIFFLLIDQMMSEHILKTVVRACWGILVPIEIGLDLSFMGIPLSFSFTLPFLPGIPFYVSQVNEVNSLGDLVNGHGTFIVLATSTLLFYAYCKMAYGLVDYVTVIVQNLTNVVPARLDGKLQDQSKTNPIHAVKSDLGKAVSPVTNRVKGVGSFAKEKLIDQKITHRDKPTEHGGVNMAGVSHEGSGSDSGGQADAPRRWVSAKPSGARPRPTDNATTGQSSAEDKVGLAGNRASTKPPGSAENPTSATADTKDNLATRASPKPLPNIPGSADSSTSAGAGGQKGGELSAAGVAKALAQAANSAQSAIGSDSAARPEGKLKSFLSAARAAVSDAPLTTAVDQKKDNSAALTAQRGEIGAKEQALNPKAEKDKLERGDDKQQKVDEQRKDQIEAKATIDGKQQKVDEQRKDQIEAKATKDGKAGEGDKQPGLDGKSNNTGETARAKDQGGDHSQPQGDKQQNVSVNKEGEGLKPQGQHDSTLKPKGNPGPEAPEKVTTRRNTTSKGNFNDK